MANYTDEGHRPHARHDGETPRNDIAKAPNHLKVQLDTWGPRDDVFTSIYDRLQANWGDAPSHTLDNEYVDNWTIWPVNVGRGLMAQTGWSSLTKYQQEYVEKCFRGETLQQVLESITFSFRIDGCTRASTHQLVRTRIGSAMMQHGGRDNDWRHRPWVLPETIRRADLFIRATGPGRAYKPEFKEYWTLGQESDERHCVTNPAPLWEILSLLEEEIEGAPSVVGVIESYLELGRKLYASLVDAGIPWEDARRLLWMGTSTYIHIDYNYLALRDFLANRLEHIMDWEINCIAQLMLRELHRHCPPVMWKYLGSHSDRAGAAKFAGLQSWPPDGKYPNPFERCECGHAKANHVADRYGACEVCWSEHQIKAVSPCLSYRPVDMLHREHRPEQNPFWILSPESMDGGPIEWIATNGTYPEELKPKR